VRDLYGRAVLADRLRDALDTDLIVVDVGARWGVGDRWRPFGPRVKVVGFDPDEEECRRLSALEPDVLYVPAALGATEGTATLYRTIEPACSSLYPPVESLVTTRPELSVIEPAGTEELRLTTLDRWLDGSPFDAVHVLKLDTQGSELGVLEGAERALAGVRVLEIEVEFNELYEGQPLFGDVDRFLRARGFVLWRLQNLVHYGLPDVPSEGVAVPDRLFYDSRPIDVLGQGGQLYWGHAYYVAREIAFPPERLASATRDAVAVAAFGFDDLAESLLRRV
jgi:FkbM family methyltransferase